VNQAPFPVPARVRTPANCELTLLLPGSPAQAPASARPSGPPAPARVGTMTLTMTREKDISLYMKDENV
jgi:hypothetical protein